MGSLVALLVEVLTAIPLVGDNFYYTVPARNFWLGMDLSPDGFEKANGVQALCTVVLLAGVDLTVDPVTMLLSLVATPGGKRLHSAAIATCQGTRQAAE